MSFTFTVPLVPISVNHYKVRTRRGHTFVTDEATGYKNAVAIFARGAFVEGKAFYVALGIVLGQGDRGDVDNFPKIVLDGLADCGMFRDRRGKWLSDAHVSHLEIRVDRKSRPKEGWTQIEVRAI